MIILAIDYGRRRVGVAIFESGQFFTIPPLKGQTKFELVDKIIHVIEEYQPELVLIGKPSHGPIQSDVSFLQNKLHEIKVRTKIVDEDLSTVQAKHEMHISGVPAKQRGDMVDSLSAQSILRAYIEIENESEADLG